MCTSFKLKSHIFEHVEGGQLLIDHLNGVKEIALKTTKYNGVINDELEEVIRIIAMCHDFGKPVITFKCTWMESIQGN